MAPFWSTLPRRWYHGRPTTYQIIGRNYPFWWLFPDWHDFSYSVMSYLSIHGTFKAKYEKKSRSVLIFLMKNDIFIPNFTRNVKLKPRWSKYCILSFWDHQDKLSTNIKLFKVRKNIKNFSRKVDFSEQRCKYQQLFRNWVTICHCNTCDTKDSLKDTSRWRTFFFFFF